MKTPAASFHASVDLGFADTAARDALFSSSTVTQLPGQSMPLAPAIHAYDVDAALSYVKPGDAPPLPTTKSRHAGGCLGSPWSLYS